MIRSIFYLFIVWVVTLTLISFISFQLITKEVIYGKNNFLQSLANWDGGHFLGIAENGYKYSFQYAFFPLYPLLISFFATGLYSNYLFWAILINIFFSLLSVLFLKKLLDLDFKESFAFQTIYAFLIFPSSFFMLAAYSESLFILLTILTFYFGRKKKYLLATFFAILSSATRLVGVATILGLWVEVFFQKDKQKKKYLKLSVLLAPLGFLIYCYFLYANANNPFFFLIAEKNWQRELIFPGLSIWEAIKSIFQGPINLKINLSLDLLFYILGLGFLIRSFRFLRPSYSIYYLFAILIPLLTSSTMSISRFLLVIFPIFILIAKLEEKYFLIYQIASPMLLALYVLLFINGYFAG